MTLTAHCLVKNEARFAWFAVMSVIHHVDKVLLWDTGSTDGTIGILREIKKLGGDKVDLREVGSVTPEGFTLVRQEMLDATKTDWFIVVDGDEIWWEESIKRVAQVVKSLPAQADSTGRTGGVESIVVPTINLIGDMYHYQEKEAGQYHLAGRVGHYNLRLVNRKIPGLASFGPHGTWGWVDNMVRMIQERDQKKILLVDAPYLHATFLPRSSSFSPSSSVPKRAHKLKYELGEDFPLDFYYPEVFFRPRPSIVHSVWEKQSSGYIARATIETPLKKIRRRLKLGMKAGY